MQFVDSQFLNHSRKECFLSSGLLVEIATIKILKFFLATTFIFPKE